MLICIVTLLEKTETDTDRPDSVSGCSSSDCPRYQMFAVSGCLITINAAVWKGVPNNGGTGEYEALLSSSQSSLYA